MDIKGIPIDSIEDDFFKREAEKDFWETKSEQERITNERKTVQATIDTVVKKDVDKVPMLKDYLKNRFGLKNGDKPHLIKFSLTNLN